MHCQENCVQENCVHNGVAVALLDGIALKCSAVLARRCTGKISESLDMSTTSCSAKGQRRCRGHDLAVLSLNLWHILDMALAQLRTHKQPACACVWEKTAEKSYFE